ncbi:RNA ligase family protein [Limibacter armeniacum]|uniref:RNA ligase family protein n=1 Tax=Limibacter armeniacum TaxID=466084 RepID=UPI002FE5AA2A
MDKYGRTYHFPFSPGTTSDDKIMKGWQGILEKELVITEKLDGENTCLKSSGVYARSHAAPTRNPWAANMWEIWNMVNPSLGELEIFGENLYGIHSIEYTRLQAYFYVFAIRDGDRWLSWDEVKFYAAMLDLPTVPVLEINHFTEAELIKKIDQGMEQESQLGGECEGFVVRTTEGFSVDRFKHHVLKYVRQNHVKTDEHWTKNWKRARLWFPTAL